VLGRERLELGPAPVPDLAPLLLDDVPAAIRVVELQDRGLRQVIRLYDQVERGEYVRATELRLAMDTYGITPKGQQDRRWKRPEPTDEPASETAAPDSPYAELRAVK
jgi:hypothetical protein